jgi:hypothetical protein
MGNAQSAKDTEQRDQALGQPRGDIRIPSGGEKARIREEHMTRPRAADEFETIRGRMEELRRERTYTRPPSKDTRVVAQTPRGFDDGRGDPARRPELQERFEHENWQSTRRR